MQKTIKKELSKRTRSIKKAENIYTEILLNIHVQKLEMLR